MTGTEEDIRVLRAMLADAPTEIIVKELERRDYVCVPSVPFDLAAEIEDAADE